MFSLQRCVHIRFQFPLDVRLCRLINRTEFDLVQFHLEPRTDLGELDLSSLAEFISVVSERDVVVAIRKRHHAFRVLLRDGENVLQDVAHAFRVWT